MSYKKYAVIGNPIAHSRSPEIHLAFAKSCGIDLNYEKIQCEIPDFEKTVKAFQKNGGNGLNITSPFKNRAFLLCDETTVRAQMARAVNAIKFEDDGSTFGDATDGVGLVNDLQNNHQYSIKNKRVLLIGAGGAASSVMGDILDEQPSEIVIANRTIEKALDLESIFEDLGNISVSSFENLDHAFDLIIHATSLSLQNQKPELPECIINQATFLLDMTYNCGVTPIMQWAQSLGASTVIDGEGMLIEQARAAFVFFHLSKS